MVPLWRIEGSSGVGRGFAALLVSLAILFSVGCGGKPVSSFVREDVEFGYVTRIAVLPFENLTRDEFAAERARSMTITQVLGMGLFDVMDKGFVDSVLREEAVARDAPIDEATLKRLGQRLNVQALLLGSVDRAEEGRRGNYVFPEISYTLRLVDAKSAMVLWHASGHRSGYSTWGRLFGVTSDDAFQVGLDVIEDILSTVPPGAAVAPEAPAEAKGS